MSTLKLNSLGLGKDDYKGAPSTLCTGCGHDLLSAQIMTACFEAGINPETLTKMSGIGCSSKTPAYFISKAFAFNSMHGRMASIATGAKLGNINLRLLGVSGDGDTASIGLGGFIHTVRRNLPICYLVANNGVYGLTKGQFSATADKNSPSKDGQTSSFETLDLCLMALESGCDFVARSYVGDSKQLIPLIQAALTHNGTALIDVISPCVTFNNHDSSTKSYGHLKIHEKQSPVFERRIDAIAAIHESFSRDEILTGLFYVNKESQSLGERLKMPDRPMSSLGEEELRPSTGAFQGILSKFR